MATLCIEIGGTVWHRNRGPAVQAARVAEREAELSSQSFRPPSRKARAKQLLPQCKENRHHARCDTSGSPAVNTLPPYACPRLLHCGHTRTQCKAQQGSISI